MIERAGDCLMPTDLAPFFVGRAKQHKQFSRSSSSFKIKDKTPARSYIEGDGFS